MLRYGVAALVCAALVFIGGPVRAEGRVALVIGNGAYQHLPRLPNPPNDARLIAATLKGLGFTLIGGKEQTDLNRAAFEGAIREFGAKLAGGSVGLFYYAGHGVQLEGVNYLVPVGANPATSADVDFELIDAGLVLKQMEAAGSKLNLVVLDACRNNPFGGRGLRAAAGGLAQMRAPTGTLISYATQPGNVAMDGTAGNSPYTLALAAAMKKPGMPVLDVFNAVGLAVDKSTNGRQQPWLSSSPIDGNFYFYGATTITVQPPTPGAPAPAEAELLFWQTIASSSNPADFQEYLRQFPQGRFAGLARNRLAALNIAGPPGGPASGGEPPLPPYGKELQLSRSAVSGVDSPLAYAGSWDRNCQALPLSITIAKPPVNGTARVVPAEETLPASTPGSGPTGPCAGKTIASHKIMYLSNPGFHGTDVMVYTSQGATIFIRGTITITVP